MQGAKAAVDGGSTYLDVRTPEEWAAGHVAGSINIPVWSKAGGGLAPNPAFVEQVESQLPDKGAALVVGCKSGKRSEVACQALAGAGYTNLTNVLGGFDAWLGAGLPSSS